MSYRTRVYDENYVQDIGKCAWAAGFFDGEGHTGVKNKYQSPAISIAQTDPRVLEKFLEAVGVGAIYGPYFKNGLDRKPVWQYHASGTHAMVAISRIWEWLEVVKREQAILVFEKWKPRR
jgi:hypothetical protein